MASSQEPNSKSWEELLRKMLPDGAPLPNEDQLDYSISFDYIGPSPYFEKPPHIIPKTRFSAFPKHAPSLTPRNPAWLLKPHSSSDTTNSDIRNLISVDDSIIFDWASDDNNTDSGDDDDDDDDLHHDQDNCSPSDEGGNEMKMKRRSSVLSSGNKNKRFCSRCGKGGNGLLRCREDCIVCGAEYCKRCILKAMGTMPEGRKCVGCIGNPIDEAKRGNLGKGSRLLVGLCSRLENKRIMAAERTCKANQVSPEQVVVNGREVRDDELDALLGCTLPLRDLRPGRYWYDKDSGLWGKEGKKPDRIISSKLDVGGKLQTGASSGNTRVYMNGREILNIELRVLKLAKVQCPRDTHFWLYEDGSYEEEGQNKIKGNIWEKASVRFICSLFSLPVPPQNARRRKEEPALFSARLVSDYLEQQRVHKLLLLGLEGSETSTVFKQARFIYSKYFTTEELQNIKLIIQRNIYRYLSTLLDGREHYEEEALVEKESAEKSVPDVIATGDIDIFFPAAAREYAPLIDEIWKDPAIQETYRRVEELQFLPDVAKYFFDRVTVISSNEYEPSEKDILFAEGVTPSNGIACIDLSFNDHSAVSETYNQHLGGQQPLSKYQMIHLNSKGLYEGCKWLEMFEGMSIIVFCISLIDYDQIWTHSTTGLQQNKMLASRNLFENVAKHSCSEGTPSLLLLTKYDQFEDKINRVPITACEWFRDFNPFKTNSKNISMAHQAFYYMAMKFKELYTSVTGRKLYVRQVRALERTSVYEAVRYMREIIEWEEVKDENIYAVDDEDLLSVDTFDLLLSSCKGRRSLRLELAPFIDNVHRPNQARPPHSPTSESSATTDFICDPVPETMLRLDNQAHNNEDDQPPRHPPVQQRSGYGSEPIRPDGPVQPQAYWENIQRNVIDQNGGQRRGDNRHRHVQDDYSERSYHGDERVNEWLAYDGYHERDEYARPNNQERYQREAREPRQREFTTPQVGPYSSAIVLGRTARDFELKPHIINNLPTFHGPRQRRPTDVP
ncbi:extra-large guanine nucleotide-binding protein 3 [Phtheirospermum japonicum]|uniref:Extra-large guanine nucleotide-binding protein 3 n=1 Tax=Phtheirospermum japonicum TaxID=374723 RepID=A0A830BDX8_9LAMI|nr:extra-large guanine nucleotide-binding protein 3 [Phtheirospermum japonicum]